MNKNKKSKQNSQHNSGELPVVRKRHDVKIIAAIPCFNEERFIGSVVLKAKNYVDLVVVVDDGSSDKTAIVAEQAGATVIKQSVNQGKGAAITIAFERAKEIGCKALVLLDGDGQHEPDDIPGLVRPVLDDQADMVVGSRFLALRSSIPRYRMLGQHILTFFTNLGSRTKLTDSQSGFRAFSPQAIEALLFVEKGLSVESEMQFLAKDANLRVMEVPVTMSYHDKAQRNPLAHGMGVLNSIFGLVSRRMPLFFFGVPGLIMLGFGLWEGFRVVRGYNEYGDFWIGPALIAVLLCIIGVLSLFTGLMLHTFKGYLR